MREQARLVRHAKMISITLYKVPQIERGDMPTGEEVCDSAADEP
jgi:hypothetical protein